MTYSDTTQDAVLMALKKYPTGLTMIQLVAETSLAHGWVSRATRQLMLDDKIKFTDEVYCLTQTGRGYTALWATP